ncbi:endoglycosylceramidase [Saccharopolyspora erythraea NRRL 2338]|nr:endoglycosylceramidase [Saccharopolyspora erythraea NRRL 2338]
MWVGWLASTTMTLRRWITAFAALALLLGLTTPAQAAQNPPPLTDLDGTPLVPRGLNNGHSAKESADAMAWTGPGDIAAEADRIGSNSTRLLVFWSRLEPRPGHYDEHYLDAVAQRVAWYERAGMRVVLDMHQDMWGPAVAGSSPNNGAPAWATHFDGLPATVQDPWPLTYLQPGVTRAFDHFWGTTGRHPELREHFTAAWRHLAQRFAGSPAVLGYDLFNEPWGGSVPWPLFERDLLGPLYQRLITEIRTVDQQHWIFVEPQALGVNQGLPSALPALHDPRTGAPRIAYAPHFYPTLLGAGQTYTGATKALVRNTMRWWFDANAATARRLGAPMVVGEFGLDATKPGALEFVDDVLTEASRRGAGWWYWSNDPGGWGPYAPGGGWAPLADHLASG